MTFYSPLRYPGGKNRLTGFISEICKSNNIKDHYVEPFTGGGSVGLYLLFENKFEKITFNDLDRSIYAFWHSVLKRTEELCDLIRKTPVNLSVWKKQKNVQKNKEKEDLLNLGFSTLFLNRTNFSGIITGGPIGGISQKGKYKLNCRFNKKEIIERIRKIAKEKKRIEILNQDCLELIKKFSKKTRKNTILYFDPPYYTKGKELYLNHYSHEDHEKLSSVIKEMKTPLIISYDRTPEIEKLYKKWIERKKYVALNHYVNKVKKGKEIIYLNNLNMQK